MGVCGSRRLKRALALAALALLTGPVLSSGPPLFGQGKMDLPNLLRRIRDEVLELRRYPGEDFTRGEFHLGEGDDDTNKTHAVGILIKEEDGGGGRRMTVVVTRLEPSAADPRISSPGSPRPSSAASRRTRSRSSAQIIPRRASGVCSATSSRPSSTRRTC